MHTLSVVAISALHAAGIPMALAFTTRHHAHAVAAYSFALFVREQLEQTIRHALAQRGCALEAQIGRIYSSRDHLLQEAWRHQCIVVERQRADHRGDERMLVYIPKVSVEATLAQAALELYNSSNAAWDDVAPHLPIYAWVSLSPQHQGQDEVNDAQKHPQHCALPPLLYYVTYIATLEDLRKTIFAVRDLQPDLRVVRSMVALIANAEPQPSLSAHLLPAPATSHENCAQALDAWMLRQQISSRLQQMQGFDALPDALRDKMTRVLEQAALRLGSAKHPQMRPIWRACEEMLTHLQSLAEDTHDQVHDHALVL